MAVATTTTTAGRRLFDDDRVEPFARVDASVRLPGDKKREREERE
jgi:hypothetical protein